MLLLLAGSLMYCMTCEGMLPRVSYERTVLLVRFRNFVFQPASLFLILSMMNWNSLFVALFWKIGKHRCFLNVLEALIPSVLEKFFIGNAEQFLEKVLLDFW